jgi:hypothetical protein
MSGTALVPKHFEWERSAPSRSKGPTRKSMTPPSSVGEASV